jgi:phosphomannomutase/phosphoglucomutase
MNSDIFREYDIRGIVGDDLTETTVLELSHGIAAFFVQNGAKRIAIGFDARESSPLFADLLRVGFNKAGIDVVSIGRVPTPVLYHAVYTLEVDGGVMITGSHNPSNYNGFKICLGTQTLFGSQIQEIRELIKDRVKGDGQGTSENIDTLNLYCEDVLSRVSLGPRKLKAVIDSGNGMGAVTALPIYKKLGIEITDLFSKPDSDFPNHHPDPTVTENLSDTIEAVKKTGADIGIAFDGDADRIGVVDETGRIIWGDELTVLLARNILKDNPGATVIAEVKCSQSLFDDIEKNGGQAIMWKAGHSIIKSKMKETGALLAGEMSGHIFFADRFYGFDDACYAGARVLEILSQTDKPLSELLSDLPKTFSTPELRIDCAENRKFEVVQEIADEFSKTNEVITIDGARIKFDDGWGLVRASNTQAILVLRFEAKTEEELNRIRVVVESRVKELISE